MKVDHFDFSLPDSLIADQPLQNRLDAKLLHVSGSEINDRSISDLPNLLNENDLLVFNDTKVIPALLFGKVDEAKIEITLHKQHSLNEWQAFAKPARKAKAGKTLIFSDSFSADVLDKNDSGEIHLRFNCKPEEFFSKLEAHGHMPLPPYIRKKRDVTETDNQNYQSIFAAKEGAVAAPTASLHFTDNLLNQLKASGVETARVTLHVGAGTFLPVKVEDTENHIMHSEWFDISEASAKQINEAKAAGKRIVAVGTTSLRALESAALEDGTIPSKQSDTQLFITPGYQFKCVDRLLTNFHLPKSTLFMLVSAFSGLENMKAAYAHAVEQQYRFFSYGDACLLERS